MKNLWLKIRWVAVAVIVVYVGLVIARVPSAMERQRTAEQVAKIHATRLSMDDVLGKNLPPDPGVEADKTVAGIDANKNGIRDDVELAIFAEYPDSPRTRAVLLQYALALQMEMTQPFINKEVVTAVAEVGDRSYSCVGEISSDVNLMRNFVEDRQLNTDSRKQAQLDFYNGNLSSYMSPGAGCDVKLSALSS